MGRNLSPVLRRELANLNKDSETRKSAMKALKSYVKDLDSQAIPLFLTQVSETKEPGSSSGEHTISLYEVLARVHGRNIVPQIEFIMSTILRTLASSAGSFPLHQACSKVVPAIARYGIDPSTPDDEKKRIICALSRPLSDVLMGSPEGVASGAALCLKALVDCDNWRFASDTVVNELCLKVAGALGEKLTQTNAHMGLVMALSKHNSLIVEAYARSLLRSGLHILSTGVIEGNSQRRLSAIQMINFLMKCVDSRSISSEIFKVIEAMENCQTDCMPFVRGAAFEALQTARIIAAQNGLTYKMQSSRLTGSNFGRENSSRILSAGGNSDNGVSGLAVGFASPESQTVDSFVDYDTFAESPVSVVQSSSNYDYARRANRRLWNDGKPVDVSLKDGLFPESELHLNALELKSKRFDEVKPGEIVKEPSGTFSGFVQASSTNTVVPEKPSPPRISQLTIDDIKIFTTPRKLIRSLQEPFDASCGCHARVPRSQASQEVEWNPTTVNGDCHSQNLNCEAHLRRNSEGGRMLSGQNTVEDSEPVPGSSESVSSSSDVLVDSDCKVLCKGDYEMKSKTQSVSIKRKYIKAALRMICGISVLILAILLSVMQSTDDQQFFPVPT